MTQSNTRPPLELRLQVKLLEERQDRLAERLAELERSGTVTNPAGGQLRAHAARIERLEARDPHADAVPPEPRGLSSLAPAFRRNRGFLSASAIGSLLGALLLELLRAWQQ